MNDWARTNELGGNTAEFDPLDPPRVVAAGLGVSTQTLANWRCQRSTPLEFVKINRMVRYRRSKWQALIAKAERDAA